MIVVALLGLALGCGNKAAEPTGAPARAPAEMSAAPVAAPKAAPAAVPAEISFTPLAPDRFQAIDAAMKQQDDWDPIRLPGFPADELVRFYIASYPPETIATWPEFAFKKLNSFPSSTPTPAQAPRLEAVLAQPAGPAKMYAFMLLLTAEQIATIGY